MITKSVKRVLLALLAISLFAGSALAASLAPIENGYTVSIDLSLSDANGAVAVTDGTKDPDTNAAKKEYTPSIKNMTAYTTGLESVTAMDEAIADAARTVADFDGYKNPDTVKAAGYFYKSMAVKAGAGILLVTGETKITPKDNVISVDKIGSLTFEGVTVQPAQSKDVMAAVIYDEQDTMIVALGTAADNAKATVDKTIEVGGMTFEVSGTPEVSKDKGMFYIKGLKLVSDSTDDRIITVLEAATKNFKATYLAHPTNAADQRNAASSDDCKEMLNALADLRGVNDAKDKDCLSRVMTAFADSYINGAAKVSNGQENDLAAFYYAMADNTEAAVYVLHALTGAEKFAEFSHPEAFDFIASIAYTNPAELVNDYLGSFLSIDAIKKGSVKINWANADKTPDESWPIANSKGVLYGDNEAMKIKATSTKGTETLLPIDILAAKLTDTDKTDIKSKTIVWHAEMTSYDINKTSGKVNKFLVEPTDVTGGITINDELIEKTKEVLVRVIFLASGDTENDGSVGILTEGDDGLLKTGTLDDTYYDEEALGALKQGYPYLVQFTLQLASEIADPFEKATVKANYVFNGASTSKDIEVTNKSATPFTLTVDASTAVSFNTDAVMKDVTVSSGSITKDKPYTMTAPAADADSVDVTFSFVSGEKTFDYVVKVIASGTDSGSEAAADKYVLNADDIDLVGSNGVTLTVAAGTTYATSQDTAVKFKWTSAPVVFNVSSDQLASFEVTVSTDNALVAVTDDEGKDVEFAAKKIDIAGIEGIYTIILSADLVVLSGDEVIKTSSDSGYFAIDFEVKSLSVAPIPEPTPEPEPEPTPSTEPVDPAEADTAPGEGGNTVAADGQVIDNAFTAATISDLINSATDAEQASIADVAGALGIAESEVGNAADGFKAIGMEVPSSVTMPAEGTPFFVITRRGSTNHVGFGYIPKRRTGFERILAIMFKLLKDPANTTNYMTVDAATVLSPASTTMYLLVSVGSLSKLNMIARIFS